MTFKEKLENKIDNINNELFKTMDALNDCWTALEGIEELVNQLEPVE